MRSRSLRPLLSLVIAVSAVVAFAAPAQAAEVVKATNFRFRPKSLSVTPGTKVVWKATQGNHTVTAYGGGWSKNKAIAQGTKTGFTFGSTGTYKYYCRIHAGVSGGTCNGMCGKVVVG